jgi:hypothetical protein
MRTTCLGSIKPKGNTFTENAGVRDDYSIGIQQQGEGSALTEKDVFVNRPI